MKQVKKPNAVYKNGKKTAKTDMHTNNRCSVFQKSKRNGDPLAILLADEKAKVENHANQSRYYRR